MLVNRFLLNKLTTILSHQSSSFSSPSLSQFLVDICIFSLSLFYSLVLFEELTWDETTNFSIEFYSSVYEAIHSSTCFECLLNSSSIHKQSILALCSSYSMNSTERLNTLLPLLQFDCLYYWNVIFPILPSIPSLQPSEISSSLLQQSLHQLLHCYYQSFHQFTQQQAKQLHSLIHYVHLFIIILIL